MIARTRSGAPRGIAALPFVRICATRPGTVPVVTSGGNSGAGGGSRAVLERDGRDRRRDDGRRVHRRRVRAGRAVGVALVDGLPARRPRSPAGPRSRRRRRPGRAAAWTRRPAPRATGSSEERRQRRGGAATCASPLASGARAAGREARQPNVRVGAAAMRGQPDARNSTPSRSTTGCVLQVHAPERALDHPGDGLEHALRAAGHRAGAHVEARGVQRALQAVVVRDMALGEVAAQVAADGDTANGSPPAMPTARRPADVSTEVTPESGRSATAIRRFVHRPTLLVVRMRLDLTPLAL